MTGNRRSDALVLVGTLMLLAAHAAVFGRWQVDDAGITYAYARHLVAGQGLVAQPGLPPVEGYSNPLWLLIVAAFWATGLFSIDWTPKILAFLLDAVVFVIVARDMAARARSPWAAALPLGLIAISSSFVIWTFSGLENSLLACLVAWLVSLSLASTRARGLEAPRPGLDRQAGLVAALIALTRPDGVVYLAVYGVLVAIEEHRRASGALRRVVVRLRDAAMLFVPTFAGYLTLRLVYFGDWAPNTLHAKQGPSMWSLLAPGKLGTLLEAAAGDAGWLMLAGALLVVLTLARRGHLEMRHVVLVTYTAAAVAIYLMMPNDWMGEFRFATPFFVLAYWTVADLALAWLTVSSPSARLRRLAAVGAACAVVQLLAISMVRTANFASCPAVPLDIVRETSRGFNALSARLGGHSRGQTPGQTPTHSVLTPDIGGLLLDSELRVYDLAGLIDPTIAGQLSSAGGTSRLHDYLLADARPTFIHISGAFVGLSGLHRDTRFARDYVALHESWDAPPGVAIAAGSEGDETPPWWGDYVRRDAIAGDAEMLPGLRRLHRDLGMSEWEVWSLPVPPDTWLDSPRAVTRIGRWATGAPLGSGCTPD